MTKFTPNINVKYTIRDQLSKFKNNKKFNTYLHAVNDIINDKETTKQEKINGLNHIIKHLSLSIENQLIEDLLSNFQEFPEPTNDLLNFPTTLRPKEISFKKQIKISIHSTPIITFPWRRERLLKNLQLIGELPNNPFKPNENHCYNIYVFPLNLVLIENGHHSTATALLENNTEITIDHYIDLSILYDSIYFNGTYFKNTHYHAKISPKYKEFGIIFEIGRLLNENNLNIIPQDIK